jgi:heptosyltransferase-1
MPRILLIKTSSLGDVVHNFPVASDIAERCPGAIIDWVVEEAYAPLVRLHPAISTVIPVAMRRWRKSLFSARTWQEIRAFRRDLAAESHDLCIDTQGLLKSALIASSSTGVKHGFDAATAREPLTARFYDVTHHVERSQHAVTRNRLLAGMAMGYSIGDVVNYGLKRVPVDAACPGFVLFHGTSRDDKMWPVADWISLGCALESRGYHCIIPWGSNAERERSQAIRAGLQRATVPDRMDFGEIARMISNASAVIGVDTGLVHLAAALGRPVVAIFRASDPDLTGVHGVSQARNLGRCGAPPQPAAVLAVLEEMGVIG